MPHVLRMKDGKLITPFDLDDVLEAVENMPGMGSGSVLRRTSRTQRIWKKSWMGCTGSMRRSWNA